MILNRSYTAELERLIIDILLPIFESYYREKGESPAYTKINPELLTQLLKQKQIPALLKPKNEP